MADQAAAGPSASDPTGAGGGGTATAQPAAVPRWLKWARRGGFSILDQGLFAGANFVLTVLLARWLPGGEFGAFTLAYSAFLLIGAFYLALVMEPFLIFAARERKAEFPRYFRQVMRWHWGLTGAGAVLMAGAAAAAVALDHRGQGDALLGMAIALPTLLQLWLMRTVFYARTEPHRACAGSALFFVLQVGGVCVLHALDVLTPFAAFAVSGVAGGIAGLAMRRMLGRLEQAPAAVATGAFWRRQVLGDHLGYARWAIGVSVIAWLCANVHYFILSSSAGGLAAVGQMRMLDNLLTPFYQCITALGQLLLPMLAVRVDAKRNFTARTMTIAGIWGGIALGAYGAFWLFGDLILHGLFGAASIGLEGPLHVYSIVVFPYVIAMALMLALRAKVRTDLVFAYHAVFAVVLTAGYVIAVSHGVQGMVWANVGTRLLLLPLIVALFLVAAAGPVRSARATAVAA